MSWGDPRGLLTLHTRVRCPEATTDTDVLGLATKEGPAQG